MPTSFAGSAENFNHQQAILNPNDNALMEDFFNNPDAAAVSDTFFPFNWPSMDQKMNGADFGGQLDGFDNDNQTIHNPAMTLGGTSSSSYQTHSSSNHNHMAATPRTDFLGNQHGRASNDDDDDVKAASGLYSMFMNSQDGSRGAATFDGAAGGSWGNFGTSNPMMHMQDLRSPLTSSGRQSANSYHSQSQNSTHANHQFQNGQQTQSQIMQQYLLQQHMAQQMQNLPPARHGSLPVDTSDFNFFPQQAQTRMPHSANLPGQSAGRPTAVRFGSDNNFSSYGYRGPSSQVPLEHEKGANLNNVPFAAQAAANGQSHMQTFTPVGPNRTYGHYSMPSGPHAYNNTSTSSSPNTLGGLPITSMTPSSRLHSHPFPAMAQPAVDDDDDVESDEDEFEESQPRKRRKSQMELEDDAEYSPPGHVKVPVPKRGAKATRAPAVDGSDDDDYEEVTPSTRTSTKRRKSSTNARPSFGSSQSGSPSAMTSPTGKPVSSSKKKRRGSQPRQNLTEDEKRRNHILSEKTRRDLIKVQYDQLDSLVPALKGGKSGLSRSDVLKEIVAYVESVVDGNKKIESKLGKVATPGASAGGYG